MSRNLLRCSVRGFLVFCAVFSCALGGLIIRNQWRNQLFAQLESVGDIPNAPRRVSYHVEGRGFGLFGSSFSILSGPTKKRWWFEPYDLPYVTHLYVTHLTLNVADVNSPAYESILRNRESLRGLETLEFFGASKTQFVPFPEPAAKLSDVRLLRLNHVIFTRQDFESIAKMPDLEILHLGMSRFQVEDLKVLQSSKHLAWLSFLQEYDPHILQEIRASLPAVFVSQFDR